MRRRRMVLALGGAGVIAALVAVVGARGGGGTAAVLPDFDLSWHTIDGGGATFSAGGGYSLGGSIGQPDAGQVSNLPYTLNGGFWGGASINYNIYLPLVLKNF